MNIKKSILAITLVTAAILGLSGCGDKEVVAPDPKASAATAVEPAPETVVTTPPPANDLVKQFGDVVTYDDGISISLGAPTAYTPGEYAQGLVEGQQPTIFKVVLTNNSAELIEPYLFVTVSSAGAESSVIGDIMHPDYGDVGMAPMTSVLPGKTIEWYVAYSVADPADITADVTLTNDLGYEPAIFTNVPF